MSDEIQRSLGRIEGKLDMVIEKNKTLDSRVSSLERTINYGLGIAAAVAAGFGVVGSYVGKALASVFVGH